MIAVENDASIIVVDCGADVVQRLLQSGAVLEKIQTLILTHSHPDHISGFPLAMQKLWLDGRNKPLQIVGMEHTLELAKNLWHSFPESEDPSMFPLDWNTITGKSRSTIKATPTWTVESTPGQHNVQNIALRFFDTIGGGVAVYSSDTEPSPSIIDLASQSDILVHDANGNKPGHSSPEGAAEVACKAKVRRLLLVHLPVIGTESQPWVSVARKTFAAVEVGEEHGVYDF